MPNNHQKAAGQMKMPLRGGVPRRPGAASFNKALQRTARSRYCSNANALASPSLSLGRSHIESLCPQDSQGLLGAIKNNASIQPDPGLVETEAAFITTDLLWRHSWIDQGGNVFPAQMTGHAVSSSFSGCAIVAQGNRRWIIAIANCSSSQSSR